ncbi:uncharacterized protein ACIB01_014655 [Guaruba guarouba]
MGRKRKRDLRSPVPFLPQVWGGSSPSLTVWAPDPRSGAGQAPGCSHSKLLSGGPYGAVSLGPSVGSQLGAEAGLSTHWPPFPVQHYPTGPLAFGQPGCSHWMSSGPLPVPAARDMARDEPSPLDPWPASPMGAPGLHCAASPVPLGWGPQFALGDPGIRRFSAPRCSPELRISPRTRVGRSLCPFVYIRPGEPAWVRPAARPRRILLPSMGRDGAGGTAPGPAARPRAAPRAGSRQSSAGRPAASRSGPGCVRLQEEFVVIPPSRCCGQIPH